MKNMNDHQANMDEHQAESFIGLDYTLGNNVSIEMEAVMKTDLNLRELQDTIEGKMNTARQVIMAYLVGLNGAVRGSELDRRLQDSREMVDRLNMAFEAMTNGLGGVRAAVAHITESAEVEDFEKGVNEGMTASK